MEPRFIQFRRIAANRALAAIVLALVMGMAAGAQSLSVLPVNVLLAPGQRATTVTVTNRGNSETAIQIRAYAWNQQDGKDQLTASNAVVVSPPLASIAAGASQVVRLILRQPPEGREATYRILVDQIPPPAEPGIVHIVFRLSIPIFAQPMIRAIPNVQFHLEAIAGQIDLVGTNEGLRHEVIRDVQLSMNDGHKLQAESSGLPYVLAGCTRHWRVAAEGPLPLPGETLRLTAHGDSGAIEQQVRFTAVQ
jgi:fimbrial chaperone protein